jgi:bifunctional DNase/RNase
MSLVRLEISSVVVGEGTVSSMVILKPHRRTAPSAKLPIRIGTVESTAISMGIDGTKHRRPMTHDLLNDVIGSLGGRLVSVVINDVRGTTFYAQLRIVTSSGSQISVDARPSDAIALAVRAHVPIFAEEEVVDTASLPDFSSVEAEERKEELERFHDFVEGLTPDDFAYAEPAADAAAGATDDAAPEARTRPSRPASRDLGPAGDEGTRGRGRRCEKPGQDLRDDLADGTNPTEHPGK